MSTASQSRRCGDEGPISILTDRPFLEMEVGQSSDVEHRLRQQHDHVAKDADVDDPRTPRSHPAARHPSYRAYEVTQHAQCGMILNVSNIPNALAMGCDKTAR